MAYEIFGSTLGWKSSTNRILMPVIKKVSEISRVEEVLSFEGRLTLIQSVLANIPIYGMSLFKMSGAVAEMLERVMRTFFWDNQEDGEVKSLVAWDIVTRSKQKGGLGIGNLKLKNVALLVKWLWRFPLEQDALWARVIRSKYGLQPNGWDSNLLTRGSFRNPWKFISPGLNYFLQNVKLQVGNGTKIFFWKDNGVKMNRVFISLTF